ncbi:hypothetical protein GCM10010387_00980 [Streptomyces inusitatus]|uniref:Lipoprotein n=1 Tax=Streptomyces inusitatus TaxID=68221 RepID=A0A918PJR1_9ACTN|nr:hypothetical protein [Streptomyces inusitatus]GGZ12868.1 hypothetical protein GCM10010387_00980 [Streptomyces inusitatus]
MRVRTSLTAAGLVAALALALTGCGGGENKSDSGSDSGGDKSKSGDHGAHTETPPADGEKENQEEKGESSTEKPKKVSPADIEGEWMGRTDGKTVTIGVKGTAVVLLAEGDSCTGKVADHGDQMLDLKCVGGGGQRTMGTVVSADDKTLVVSWDKGKKDTLTKADLGLPTKLPSLEAVPAS